MAGKENLTLMIEVKYPLILIHLDETLCEDASLVEYRYYEM
jgi:hypothetical protein